MDDGGERREAPGRTRPAGMRAFWFVWSGQFVSLLGSGMTQFALTVWAFDRYGTATALALLGVFFTVPLLALSPVVGVLVDRHDRKLMMMVSDLAAGLTTVGILALYATGRLEIWHLYVSAAINGAFQGFQWPAYSAAMSLMIPKSQYVRANSMMEIVGPGSGIAAPAIAGAVLGLGRARGVDLLPFILLFDIVSFTAAIGALLWVRIPSAGGPAAPTGGGWPAFAREASFGWRYIFARPSLLGLQLVFMGGNFLFNVAIGTLEAPMLLARTGSNAGIYGAAQTIAAIGLVVGGLVVAAKGGLARRVHGVLGGWLVSFVLGSIVIGLGAAQPPWRMGLWAVGIFASAVVAPLINGSNQAIWMAKVPPELQGRVFSTRRLIAWVASPAGALVAGPLADHVMEPAMRPGGALADRFGPLVGTGPGAGMSLIFIAVGAVGALFILAMWTVPAIRYAEDRLPDHMAAPPEVG